MIPEKVQRILDQYDLKVIQFEKGTTPTAPLAAKALGVTVGQIAKSLLFVSREKKFFMVVCPGDRKVSSSRLKSFIGVKTRMADASETFKATGFNPGGVCPFGVNEIPILLDKHLKLFDTIYPAAGTDSTGVPMTFEQLKSITGAREYDLTLKLPALHTIVQIT